MIFLYILGNRTFPPQSLKFILFFDKKNRFEKISYILGNRTFQPQA